MGQPVEGFYKNGNKNEEESEKRKIDFAAAAAII